MPTQEPRLAGLTKSGYLKRRLDLVEDGLGLALRSGERVKPDVAARPGGPRRWNAAFITILSMPTAEPTTPAPT